MEKLKVPTGNQKGIQHTTNFKPRRELEQALTLSPKKQQEQATDRRRSTILQLAAKKDDMERKYEVIQ